MAVFTYKIITKEGEERTGTIDALNEDVAITSLQRRGFVIVSISTEDRKPFFERSVSFFNPISNRDVVILSRQIATLFSAQVSALRAFRLLAAETGNKELQKILTAVSDDIQSGTSLSVALARHPDAFSTFYVNMVHAGEESGKLNETFSYLADYLDRSYDLASKTKNALIYPAFVIATFVVVMILMLTVVIPRLSAILAETGQAVPIYTRIVLGVSAFLTEYGIFFFILLIIGVFFLFRYAKTDSGKIALSRAKLETPYVGDLYAKLYLSRISDNMHTMLSSGISMIRAIEVTSSVVGNDVYASALKDAGEAVKSGRSLSDALSEHKEIPAIVIAMIKIGEETGELGNILKTLAQFYKREVDNAVDTLISLIEPVMIVALGLGVGLLLTSVLVPIYNITAGI